jgi:hypothetical protein
VSRRCRFFTILGVNEASRVSCRSFLS